MGHPLIPARIAVPGIVPDDPCPGALPGNELRPRVATLVVPESPLVPLRVAIPGSPSVTDTPTIGYGHMDESAA